MKLYDAETERLKECLSGLNVKKLREVPAWPALPSDQMILRSDMAYELGGDGKPAVSGLGVLFERKLETAVYLAGPDLTDIKSNSPYARFVLVSLKNDYTDTEENRLYGTIKKIDYLRYKMFLDGFSFRISGLRDREAVRVSKKAVASKISFGTVGRAMLNAYLALPEVESCAVIFVTDGKADFGKLEEISRKMSGITDSLEHIFTGLKMDCSTCELKPVCDEVEDLRRLHFGKTQ